jgi:hypothetical protein
MFTAKTFGSVCNAGFPVLLIRSPHRTEAKLARRIGFYSLLLAVYLVSTVPVGLFLYSLKTAVGFDLFKEGGVHAYMQCLRSSFPLADGDADNAGVRRLTAVRSSELADRLR